MKKSDNTGSAGEQANPEAPDPFDLASLRLDQDFTDTGAVKKLTTTIPVRKPNRQEFVRVHTDPAFRLSPAGIITFKEENETYMVTPALARELASEIKQAAIRDQPARRPIPLADHLARGRWQVESLAPLRSRWRRGGNEGMG